VPSDAPDDTSTAEATAGGTGTDGADDRLTEADVERIVRRVAREELDDRDGRDGSVWTVLAGAVVGLFVFMPLSGAVLGTLADAGVPLPALSTVALFAAAALVAYGWRLPPFR